MKRVHLHFTSDNLDHAVKYYAALLGAEPTMLKDDHAKWVLDDPRIHLSVSTNCQKDVGLEHVGISIDTEEELDTIANRMEAIGAHKRDEKNTTCCYARSNKYWLLDPHQTIWELFQTFDEAEIYGEQPDFSEENAQRAN